MAFDGAIMSTRDQALKQAEKTGELMRGLESRITWGIKKADEEGAFDIKAALVVADLIAKALHNALNLVAELIAARYGDSPTLYSGGDDKPPPPPPEG
jgi:hypothetical protein